MAFLVHLMPRPTKKTTPTIWFSDMWVPELLLPPKIIRMLAQKRPFLPQKTPIYFIWNILYTTYIILLIINGSHSEWENSNLDHLHNADQSRHTAERIRAEVEFVYSRPRGSSIIPQKILILDSWFELKLSNAGKHLDCREGQRHTSATAGGFLILFVLAHLYLLKIRICLYLLRTEVSE